MYDAWVNRRPRRKEGEFRGRHGEWKIDDEDIAATVEAVFRISGAGAAVREIQRWTPYEVRLRVALEVVPRLVADGHGQALLDFANSASPLGPWRLLITVPLALAGFQVDSSQLMRDIGRVRAKFIPQQFGISSASPSWATEWMRVVVTAIEILHANGGYVDALKKTCRKLVSLLTQNVISLRASDAARVDALMRLWILDQTLNGKPAEKAGFLEFAHTIGGLAKVPRKPVKRKGSKKESYERDQEQEQTDRKLSILFGAYVGRMGVIEKARTVPLTASDVSSLGSTTHSYELDSGYEAVYLRQVAARSISELAFLPSVSIPDLCAASLAAATKEFGTYHGREASLLLTFRLRRDFHADLLAILGKARDNARQRRTRATEKVADLVTLARFVFPVSRPDAEALFGDAAAIAKEIDDEAIDQIDFVAHASNTVRASRPSDDAVLARKFATFVGAASVRLEGHDEFSWDDAIRGLARLHAPTAFACSGRWMDDGTASLRYTLPPLLLETLTSGELSPARAAALSLLVEGPDTTLIASLARSVSSPAKAGDQALIEELARATLLADGQSTQIGRAKLLLENLGDCPGGTWIAQVRELVAFAETKPVPLAKEPVHATTARRAQRDAEDDEPVGPFAPAPGGSWRQALEDAVRAAASDEHRGYPAAVLTTISNNLRSPADRAPFLDGLTTMDTEIAGASDWSLILSRVLEEWESTPAIQRWTREKLPSVISKHLTVFSRWIRYRQSNLDELLDRTEAVAAQRVSLLLDGIAASGSRMGSAALFGIASRIVSLVTADDAKRILDWYLDRLVMRLPADDVKAFAPQDTPTTAPVAISRFLFSLLSDIDTRVRWRCAHAVRFLARLDDAGAISDLFAEYERVSDHAFRDPEAPFYDLGAKLWLTLLAYRLSSEAPQVLTASQGVLLRAALSPDLPHIVVREYAKRALLAASSNGAITLSTEQRLLLLGVNTPMQRLDEKSQRRSFGWNTDRKARRFAFDEMDTLPYWYNDLLNMFPRAAGDDILAQAERWILDVWKAPIDVNKWVMEPRRETRLSDRGYDLWSHRHGSLPTVERYSTYLEWHAMLCVAGELLAQSPLGPKEYGEDRLQSWLERFMPTQPPAWLSDNRGPTPLHPYLWWEDRRSDNGWLHNCRADEYYDALGLLSTAPEGWLVVAASVTSNHPTREQHSRVNSALVSPSTAAALTRALQTVRDPWDFRIPDENDDLQFAEGPYRLTGWLSSSNGDSRFDDHDPMRFDVRAVQTWPGRRVTQLFKLARGSPTSAHWTGSGRAEPSFKYEAWSDEAPSDHQSERITKSEGWRLLAKIDDVAEFLAETGDDLICEISIERKLRSQYGHSYEPEAKQKKHFKIVVLTRDGGINDFRGNAGIWKKPRRGVPA